VELEESIQARALGRLSGLGDDALDAGAEGVRGSAERSAGPDKDGEGAEADERRGAPLQRHELPLRVGGGAHTRRCRKSVTIGQVRSA